MQLPIPSRHQSRRWYRRHGPNPLQGRPQGGEKNQDFDHAEGSLKAYKLSIPDNDNNSIRLLQEKNWSCKLDCQAAIRIAEHIGKKFVLSQVEEMWVVCLKNDTTLFKYVTLRDILAHVVATSTGGEAIDVISLQQGSASSRECHLGGLKTQEFHNLLPAAMAHSGRPGKLALPSRTSGLLPSHTAPSSQRKASRKREQSSRGCLDSTGLGKSENPTSKTRRRRSSTSCDIPTPLWIPSDRPTPLRAFTVSHITETPCIQRHTKAKPRSHHQAPSRRSHSSIPSADSCITWRPLQPTTRLFLYSLSLIRTHSILQSRCF